MIRALVARLAIATLAAVAFPATSSAADVAHQRWSSTLPAGSSILNYQIDRGTIVAAGSPATFVFNESSGTIRWQTADHTSALVLAADTEYFGNETGGVGARRVSDGALLWHHANVCASQSDGRVGRVSQIVRIEAHIVAGCAGGRIVQFEAKTGAIEARSDGFIVDQVQRIVPLGSCAYGISGVSSGAIMQAWSEILSCHGLHDIRVNGRETFILGATGNTAIVRDACCFLGGSNLPIRITRVDLRSGAASPSIALSPEAAHDDGLVASSALIGKTLYVGTADALFAYSADSLSATTAPHRMASNLRQPPMFLGGDVMIIRPASSSGEPASQLVLLAGPAMQSLLTYTGFNIGMFQGSERPDIVTIGSSAEANPYADTTTGRTFLLDSKCRPVASGPRTIAATCTTATLVGNTYLQRLVAFDRPR